MVGREFDAGARFRQRADRIDAGESGCLGAPQHVGNDRRRIERRFRVGHAGDRGETAGHGRRDTGGDRFLVRETGFAQVDVHVDEARRNDRAGGVDHPRICGVGVLRDLADEAVLDDDIANSVESVRRIDDPAAANDRLHAVTSALLMRNSSTAMRTNTPLCT